MRSKIVNHAVIICKIFFKVFSRLGKIFNMHKAKLNLLQIIGGTVEFVGIWIKQE